MGVIVRSSGFMGYPMCSFEHPTVDREGARLGVFDILATTFVPEALNAS